MRARAPSKRFSAKAGRAQSDACAVTDGFLLQSDYDIAVDKAKQAAIPR